MGITTINDFAPGDRYVYDFEKCTYAKGWAQVDTTQDASYYGTWCNPTARKIFSYCEGDLRLVECDTDEEFVSEIRKCADWNREAGYWLGIDADILTPEFKRLGLTDLLH